MPGVNVQGSQQNLEVQSTCPDGFKNIPLTAEYWKTEYDGYGAVTYQTDQNLISMAPQAARSPANTHASLVLSKFNIESDNFDLIVEYKNVAALREENPNPWEVFWLFFNYLPGADGTKTTNYVVPKPNGFELGRASQLVDQQFIKTSEDGKAVFNEWHKLRVQVSSGLSKFYFNERYIFDTPSSALFTSKGKVGLYTEDAAVEVKRVCLNSEVVINLNNQ